MFIHRNIFLIRFFYLYIGNNTVAVVKIPEDYECLRQSLSNVTEAVNSLVSEGAIMIDGKRVKLEFFLGGDYKVCVLDIYILYFNGTFQN